MIFIANHFKKFDWLLTIAIFILCAVSLITLRGIDLGGGTNYFFRQLIFLFIALTAMAVTSFLDVRIFKNRSAILVAIYFLAVLTLVAVLFSGLKTRGTLSWFRIGSFGFEPVELAKIAVILVLAKYFSNRHVEVYRIRHIIVSAIYAFLPVGLVLLQPDLGSSLVIIFVWLGIILLSGIKLRHLIIVLLIGALLATVAWAFVLKPYQKDRIMTFLNPARDPLGSSYNLIQAKIAIGSGGFWGKGLGRGSQSQLNFLPEKNTDFIFAVLAEEWGFFGVLFLCSFFVLLLWRIIKICVIASNNFFRLFAVGYALIISVQVFINIGMNLGIMPVTGIPLPFISSGGSNLLFNFLAIGLLQNIIIQSKKEVGGV